MTRSSPFLPILLFFVLFMFTDLSPSQTRDGHENYDWNTDQMSRAVFDYARTLASGDNDLPSNLAAIDQFTQEKEKELIQLWKEGEITREQYDGGPLSLRQPGGELGEVQIAARLAKDFLADPTKLDQMTQDPWFFTSDIFHNLTLIGQTADGSLVHLRMGTHGGLEYRSQNPRGDGFPLAGSKWVEGSLVLGGKIWSFRSLYTDHVDLVAGSDGRTVRVKLDGLWDTKDGKPQALAQSPQKWSQRMEATPSAEKVRVQVDLMVTSHGDGHPTDFGVAGLGYSESNYALQIESGTITIDHPDGPITHDLVTGGYGQEEVGLYYKVPRALPVVYDLAQGQAIDTQGIVANLLTQNPRKLDGYLAEPLKSQVTASLRRGTLDIALIEKIDAAIRELAMHNVKKRWELGQIFAAALDQAKVPMAGEKRATTTQFMARLLADDPASRLVSSVLAKAMRYAGSLTADGDLAVFRLDLSVLNNTNPWLDPLVVLDNNYVPLYADGFSQAPALLERRTVLTFDRQNRTFAVGFQEVFHSSPMKR